MEFNFSNAPQEFHDHSNSLINLRVYIKSRQCKNPKEMLYLLGYILGCFIFVAGLGLGLSTLHSRSSMRPETRKFKRAPLIKSRALISFSIILPFVALSFLVLTFMPMRIAQNQGIQGRLFFALTSLVVPTLCFLIGFYYFRKTARA